MEKKFILLSIVILLTTVLQAQFKVYSDGDIGVNATDPDSRFCINTDGHEWAQSFFYNNNGADSPRTLQIKQKSEGSSAVYGLLAGIETNTGGNGPMIGVYGCAYRGTTTTSQNTIGVYGITGNGNSGFNYAVYGELLGDRNGAGVFGTTDAGANINGKYAGYFKGDVHITGDLTVDGSYPSSGDINLKKDIRNLDDDVLFKLS